MKVLEVRELHNLEGMHTCPDCLGWGTVEAGYYGDETETCDTCAGKGKLDARAMYRALMAIGVDHAEEELLGGKGGTWRFGFARRVVEVAIDDKRDDMAYDLEELEELGPPKPHAFSTYVLHVETADGPRDLPIDPDSFAELEACRCAAPPKRMRTVTITREQAESADRLAWQELEREMNRCYCESCQKAAPEDYV